MKGHINMPNINLGNCVSARLAVSCIVCGGTVDLTSNEETALRYGHHIGSKVCDECKQAILHVRNQMIGDKE